MELPVLYVDDNPPLAQSGAIEKYIASMHGFNGENELEAAYIEMVTSQLKDVTFSAPGYYEDLFKHKILPSMKFIENVMGCNEYIVGK